MPAMRATVGRSVARTVCPNCLPELLPRCCLESCLTDLPCGFPLVRGLQEWGE